MEDNKLYKITSRRTTNKIIWIRKRSKTINNFCRSIADTRNYLTHGDSLSKYEAAITNARDLYYVTLKLQCILDVLILKKLDLDDSTIEKASLDTTARISLFSIKTNLLNHKKTFLLSSPT